MKRCTLCLIERPIADFWRARRAKDGLMWWCKQCVTQYKHRWCNSDTGRAKYKAGKHREYIKHQSMIRQQQKLYYLAHRKVILDRVKQYHIRRPDVQRMTNARRRARLRGGVTERVSYEAVFTKAKGRCGICHGRVARAEGCCDHIVPLKFGGEHSYRNIQLAHRQCNAKKGTAAIGQQLRLVA